VSIHRLVLPIVVITALLLPPGVAPAVVGAAEIPREYAGLPPDLTALHFPPTGYNLAGGFLRFWWENGQVPIFGYPLTDELSEGGRTVQYFERARLEYFPELKGTPYEVQLGHLGRRLVHGRTEAAFRPIGPVGESPDRDYIEATRHTIAYAFKRFWQENGGVRLFGYPLSEELSEDGRTVQYFERARFEYDAARRGTPDEVQLSHVGRQALAAADVKPAPVGRRADATVWTPDLAGQVARRLRAERQQTWLKAVATEVEPFQAVVTVPAAEIRQAPTVAATRLAYTYERHVVRVVGVATGEPVQGDARWYQLAPGGGYLPAASIAPFTPPAPPRVWPGRWLDVNLSDFYVTAYEGSRPIYSALITAGRDQRTPLGVFTIFGRVRSETMDSATVGFPRGHPEHYFLENVEFTQYFTGQGHALHGNYWTHPSRFGRFSSNGCIGVLTADAAWFWEFATVGTPIHIHF
jgi:hypothetical protein